MTEDLTEGPLTEREAALVQKARRETLEGAATELEDLRTDEILLSAGEMTAQELRSVRAILNWRARMFRHRASKVETQHEAAIDDVSLRRI